MRSRFQAKLESNKRSRTQNDHCAGRDSNVKKLEFRRGVAVQAQQTVVGVLCAVAASVFRSGIIRFCLGSTPWPCRLPGDV